MEKIKNYLRLQLGDDVVKDSTPSLFNRIVFFCIILGIAAGILGTEPLIYEPYKIYFKLLETTFLVIFSLEYLARLWVVEGSRFKYLFKFINIIDLLVIVSLFSPVIGVESAVLRIVRLFRIFMLLKLSRYSMALHELYGVLKYKKHELILSLFIAFAVLLFSSTGMYFFEAEHQPDKFGSIPRSLWWSIATLTTVGYGDVYPITVLGKIFAGFTAVAGIGLFALPAGIISSAFSELRLLKKKNEGV